MTSSNFDQLFSDIQIHLLNTHGIYIGKRKIDDCIAVLYQLEEVYVEIYYFKYRLQIASINCSASTDMLSQYLEQLPNVEFDKLFNTHR